MSYQTIQFEGCTVAVIAPEDLEAKDAELDHLRRELAEAQRDAGILRYKLWVARRAIDELLGYTPAHLVPFLHTALKESEPPLIPEGGTTHSPSAPAEVPK